MKRPLKLWVGLLAGGTILVGATCQFWGVDHPVVYVLSGLSEPATVLFDHHPPLTVEPGQHPSLVLHSGTFAVEVRYRGKVLSKEEVFIPSGKAFVAYNVLGSAPLYRRSVRYSESPAGETPSAFEPLSGHTLVVDQVADDVFRPPPETVEMTPGTTTTTRQQIELAGDGTWEVAASLLLRLKQAKLASSMLMGVLAVDDEALAPAIFATERGSGPEEAIAVLKKVVQERPDWYDAHRLLQRHLRAHDGIEKTRAWYRARVAAHPDSSFEQLLLARLDGTAEAEKTLRRLLKEAPKDPRLLQALASVLARQERWDEVASLLDEVPEGYADSLRYLDLHVAALMATGRSARGLALAQQAVKTSPRAQALILAAEVARSGGTAQAAAALVAADEKSVSGMDVVRATLGLPAGANEESRTAKLIRAAARGPAEAFKRIKSDDDSQMEALGEPLLILLAAEFHRMGEPGRAEALMASADTWIPAAAVYAYVERGEEGPDVQFSGAHVLAALRLARALALEAQGKDGSALRTRAKELEVPAGFIAAAAAHWPRGVAPPAQLEEDTPLTFVRVSGEGLAPH